VDKIKHIYSRNIHEYIEIKCGTGSRCLPKNVTRQVTGTIISWQPILAKTIDNSSVPGSMTFWCGSGSGSADPCPWLMDPDPAIFVIDPQEVNKKIIFYNVFLRFSTYNDTKFETSTDVDEQNTLSITYYKNLFRSRIHERKISLRCLDIILRVLRLDVSIYCTIFTIQTSIKPLLPKNSGSDRAIIRNLFLR
jgi:hypothetical protein